MHFWENDRGVTITPLRRQRPRVDRAAIQVAPDDVGFAVLLGGLGAGLLATHPAFTIASNLTVAALALTTLALSSGLLWGVQRLRLHGTPRPAASGASPSWLQRRGVSAPIEAQLFSSVATGLVLVLLPLLHPASIGLWAPWLLCIGGAAGVTMRWLAHRTPPGRTESASPARPLHPVIAIGPGWTAAPMAAMIAHATARGPLTGRVFAPMQVAGYLMANLEAPLPGSLAWPTPGRPQATSATLLRLIWHAQLEEQSTVFVEVRVGEGAVLEAFPFRLLTPADVRALQLGEVREVELLQPRLVQSVEELLASLATPAARDAR